MGWLRLVGSLKTVGLFCKRALQKRLYDYTSPCQASTGIYGIHYFLFQGNRLRMILGFLDWQKRIFHGQLFKLTSDTMKIRNRRVSTIHPSTGTFSMPFCKHSTEPYKHYQHSYKSPVNTHKRPGITRSPINIQKSPINIQKSPINTTYT